MKKQENIVSIDGGGTNTRVVVSKNGNKVFKQFHFGLNYKKCDNVTQSFEKVINYIGEIIEISNVNRFIFGLAGIDINAKEDIGVYKSIISKVLKIADFEEKIKIVNDIYLVDGLLPNDNEDRIIVICATGSNVLYKKDHTIQTNSDIGFHSLGGTRHIVEYFINHTPKDKSPSVLIELLEKYKGNEFDKEQLQVIDDFKRASFLLLNNVQNIHCREACLYGIHSMIDGILKHMKESKNRPAIYLYGGQFKSKDYKDLFIQTLNDRKIAYSSITQLMEEAVFGGLHL